MAVMFSQRRALGCLVLIAVAVAGLAETTPAAAYPSSSAFNPRAVLDEQSWALFTGIGGFDRVPSAHGDETGVLMRWNVTAGSYSVVLNAKVVDDYDDDGAPRDARLVSVTCTKYDGEGNETFRMTLSQSVFDTFLSAEYNMTAVVDAGDVVHVLWERKIEYADVPNYYWLFHETVDGDGSVLLSSHLFYFEKRGGYLPPHLDYRPVAIVATVLIFSAAVGGVLWKRRRKTRGREERGLSGPSLGTRPPKKP